MKRYLLNLWNKITSHSVSRPKIEPWRKRTGMPLFDDIQSRIEQNCVYPLEEYCQSFCVVAADKQVAEGFKLYCIEFMDDLDNIHVLRNEIMFGYNVRGVVRSTLKGDK